VRVCAQKFIQHKFFYAHHKLPLHCAVLVKREQFYPSPASITACADAQNENKIKQYHFRECEWCVCVYIFPVKEQQQHAAVAVGVFLCAAREGQTWSTEKKERIFMHQTAVSFPLRVCVAQKSDFVLNFYRRERNKLSLVILELLNFLGKMKNGRKFIC
jgi:hypothetical protein